MSIRRTCCLTFLLVHLFLISFDLHAKDSLEVRKAYVCNRINPSAPLIDGHLDDEAWAKVDWEGDFRQISPYENKPPSQPTAFKILYDDDNLYIAIRCYDSAPDSIVRHMSRRDGFDGDWVEVNIDSYHDLRTAFSFSVSASGVKGDEAITNDSWWDASWDPIWYVKTQIDGLGWTAEYRIPFSQLRFGKQDAYVWGLQVNRRLFRKMERSSWQFISPKSTGWVNHFGELYGIKKITPKKQRDITPYVVGQSETYQREEGNPFASGKDFAAKAGVDGKLGLTNDLTLDFTINPDFGQVEADPSEVNLTTYETYFQEKRPFFIEGKDILSLSLTPGSTPLSSDNLFYSRRIGKRPGYSPDTDDDEYIKRPDNTTILGAAKVTGKTRSGWSVGILESVTQTEHAMIAKEEDRRKVEIEPMTNYFAGRIQKDLNDNNTRVGFMVTATNRNLTDSALTKEMHKAAYTGGINFNHEWKDKTYYINLQLAGSYIEGSAEAMLQTQTNSPHFFQRPDAGHVKVDSAATHVLGHGGYVQYGKAGNGKLRYSTWITWRSPGFNTNDIGYTNRNDEVQEIFWMGYIENEPFYIFRSMNLNISQWYGTTFGFERRYFGGNFNAHAQFKNYWGFGIGIDRDGYNLSTNTLRGGSALRNNGSTNYWGYFDSDYRKKITLSASGYYNRADQGVAQSTGVNVAANWQVFDALKLSIAPGYSTRFEELEYVDSQDDLPEARYIRGRIEQTQTSVTIRMNYNFTPDFTIQFYAMPFVSAGKYKSFKYITDAKAPDFENRFIAYSVEQISYNTDDEEYLVDENGDNTTDYSFGNPDFKQYDFNSNLVIRWEYLPGSTLYLVWNQNRSKGDDYSHTHFGDDINTLFDLYPHDVFLVKFSYRFGK